MSVFLLVFLLVFPQFTLLSAPYYISIFSIIPQAKMLRRKPETDLSLCTKKAKSVSKKESVFQILHFVKIEKGCGKGEMKGRKATSVIFYRRYRRDIETFCSLLHKFSETHNEHRFVVIYFVQKNKKDLK